MDARQSSIAIAGADARIRRRLWVVLCIYETLVVSIVAGAGLNIALMGGGSIFMAAPLLLISCAEALRIPLAAMATRLRWGGKMLAAVALLAIAIGSAEGLVVAFEAFLDGDQIGEWPALVRAFLGVFLQVLQEILRRVRLASRLGRIEALLALDVGGDAVEGGELLIAEPSRLHRFPLRPDECLRPPRFQSVDLDLSPPPPA